VGAVQIPFLSVSFQPDERLRDTIALAIKPALAEALQLSEAELAGIIVSDETIRTRASSASLPDIFDTVLQAIKDSSFVICDTTGNRANCYLELGYALGYGKQVFILHRKDGSPPEFNIRNRPIIFYTGAVELKEKLLAALRDSGLCGRPTPALELASFFKRCKLPVVPLEGDGHYEYRISTAGGRPVTVDPLSSPLFSPPSPWDERFRQTLAVRLDQAEKEGEVLFNGDLIRLRDFHPRRDESTRERYLRLEVERTNYYTFVSTNFGLEHLPDSQKKEVVEHEMQNFGNLRESWLANPLTVNIAVVAHYEGREWVLIQERNTSKLAHHKGRCHASCAGMISPKRDLQSLGLDVYAAARNELEEELGITVGERDFALLGLVRETDHGEIGLIFEVSLAGDPNRLLNPAPDAFETIRVFSCELTPEHVAGFIRAKGGPSAFSGLGLATLIFSLLKRFPTVHIESSLR
jgi:8-oxo-dGTP pyrophosphatase MutT (NUDIX family)